MKMRIAILASCAVAAVFVAGGVHAETLKPIQARSIDLGTLAGIAYYTVEPEGYRLVATLTPSGTDTPVRFVATLAPGPSVTLSTARMLGKSAVQVRFMRRIAVEIFVARSALARREGPCRGLASLMRPQRPLPAGCSWGESRYAEARTSTSAVVAAVCVGGVISTSLSHVP